MTKVSFTALAVVAVGSLQCWSSLGDALHASIERQVDDGATPRMRSTAQAVVSPLRALGHLADLSLPSPAGSSRIVVRVPSTTPNLSELFLAGSFSGWLPDDPGYRLTKIADGVYAGLVDGDQPFSFKVTRGDWSNAETWVDGAYRADREVFVRDGQDYEVRVAGWEDQTRGAAISRVTKTARHDVMGGRGLWLYTPAGFSQDMRRYPTLALFDGQNVFDSDAPFGSWRAKGTLDRLIADGEIPPLLAVGIEHGRDARLAEYNPWDRGAWHLAQVKDELLPWLERHAQADLSDVGLAGSSLGGLLTLDGVNAQSQHFHRFLSFSPSLFLNDFQIMRDFALSDAPIAKRMWMDIGVLERDGQAAWQTYPRLQELRQSLLARGRIDEDRLAVRLIEGSSVAEAGHTEEAWARRFADALRFLYADRRP